MTPLDLPLPPAQWEHLDRHDWTLTEAPMTECRNTLHDLRDAPVSEYHCPECGRAPYRSKDNDWYCFDPKGESACRWRGPNPKVTPCCAPVPATVPCPECDGKGWWSRWRNDVGYRTVTCKDCHGSGVVPRTVGITRAEGRCECAEHGRWNGERYTGMRVNTRACPWHKTGGVIPAERVGTATVTPVPVVDKTNVAGAYRAVPWVPYIKVENGRCFMPDNGWRLIDVTALFATPPAPGTTVWRLDKENNDA